MEPAKPKATWSQRYTDFVVVLKSGEELGVHKLILAENSPVFEAMLDQDMMESRKNLVRIDNFGEATVISFLEYIYSKPLLASGDEETTGFDATKFNVDLLSMAHFYQVDSLVRECSEHLKGNICDDNVMDVWMEAERCGSKILRTAAIEHLIDRPEGLTLEEVPGFKGAFQAYDTPLKDLIDTLIEQNKSLKDEIHQLNPTKDLDGVAQRKGMIRITLRTTKANPVYCEHYVSAKEKISTFLTQLEYPGMKPDGFDGKYLCLTKDKLFNMDYKLDRNRTFKQSGISQNTTLYLWQSWAK